MKLLTLTSISKSTKMSLTTQFLLYFFMEGQLHGVNVKSQRTACRTLFSPSIIWDPGAELSSSSLGASKGHLTSPQYTF